MWINRDLESKLIKTAGQRPAVIVTGARQVGKTELLKHTFPDHAFVTLDLPSAAESADKDGFTFLKNHPAPLIIDEAQYAPGLFRPLKKTIDAQRHTNGRYLLSGSQKFQLMNEISESLAGRAAIIEMETLSLSEINSTPHSFDLEAIILRGGYPELYQRLDLDKNDFYSAYIATYLERDLRSLVNVRNLRDFEKFLRACAFRSGNLLNRSDLARDAGISQTTANQWISLLVTSNIISLLEPWFINPSKSITKSPKLYFCDTGLLCFLLNLFDRKDIQQSPLLGNIWETFVYGEIRKQQKLKYGVPHLYFYRDRSKEIDFLSPKGGRYELYEVKWQETPKKKDIKRMNAVAALIGAENIISRTVLCRTPVPYPIDDHTMAKGPLHLAF